MASGVVTVGRHRYAVGLYWENSPGGGRVAQIAKEAARQPGQQADFYAVRPGNKDGRIPQFGLCANESGQKAGMPVLAACMASEIPGSWAGAFRVPEGIVVVVVRDELIVPDGDVFFKEESEARDRLAQEVGFGGLQSIYAPESWSIPGADAIPITLLLNEQRETQLQRVTIPRETKIMAAGGVALLVALLSGLWIYEEKEEEARALAERQHQIMLRAQQSSFLTGFNQANAPLPIYDRRWEKSPAPMAVVKACTDGLAKIPSAFAGWKLLGLKCSGTSIALTWSREKGATMPPTGASVIDNGTTASLTMMLGPLSARGSESLTDMSEITNRYLAQNWPGPLARTSDDPAPPPPSTYSGPWNPPPAPWVKRSFTLTVAELPAGLPEYFGGLPGVIINAINFAPSGAYGLWSVEGVIYENRK